jgi:hypothetical protein
MNRESQCPITDEYDTSRLGRTYRPRDMVFGPFLHSTDHVFPTLIFLNYYSQPPLATKNRPSWTYDSLPMSLDPIRAPLRQEIILLCFTPNLGSHDVIDHIK